MNFDFNMPTRLIASEGCVVKNSQEFANLGNCCLIVTSPNAGKKSGALADVVTALGAHNIAYSVYDQVEQNPTLLGSYAAGQLARERGADFIVGIGGGSPLDAAKAAAIFAANPMEDPMDLYRLDWENPALPLIAIGTTAGTGSEVGPASVLTTPENLKRSISHLQCYPKVTFGDWRYTSSLSLPFTISTALDALSHAVEGYFSTAANQISDLFAVEALQILWTQLNLLAGVKDGQQITDHMRKQLYYASVLAGFTLARCGTCYCHAMSYYLTEQYGFAHGTACAVFLPDFIQRGVRLLPDRAKGLFPAIGCTSEQLVALVQQLCRYPETKLTQQEIQMVAARTAPTGNFARTAPNGYTGEEAAQLLQKLFE